MLKKLLLASLCLFQSITFIPGVHAEARMEDLTYESRGVQVPATFTAPEGENYPIVFMLHGHGGSRQENIGFSVIAQALADQGIASFRMDFPGSGESTEDFSLNNMTNMKEDVQAALDYVKETYPINSEKIGFLGYSMGGRVTLELLSDGLEGVGAVSLIAPAVYLQGTIFKDSDHWNSLKEKAINSEEGYVVYETVFGQIQHLSPQWFTDLEKYPEFTLADAAKEKYQGPSQLIYAVNDSIIVPEKVLVTAEALGSQTIAIPDGDHGYGFYDETEGPVLALVKSGVVAFFDTQFNQTAE